MADLACAGAAFIASLPVLAVAALLVRLTSPGPALYSQRRLGRGGRPFTIYKLRSMRHDCEKDSGVKWSTPGDVRVTRVGRWLRRTHVDELPQLWNVLRGDMSLIGPRPERPELTPALERALPGYRDRLMVKPGLTGLAQIQLPPDTDLGSVRRKLILDRYYVRRRGAWLDLRVAVATAFYLLGLPFPALRMLFAFPAPTGVAAPFDRAGCQPQLKAV
jgi:lipopolysaccharide/colanic/teichoic acid biosynthesis glycosyltransferase